MKYVTSADKAREWGISPQRVLVLIEEGRIRPKPMKIGRDWVIPDSAQKPEPLKRHTRE